MIFSFHSSDVLFALMTDLPEMAGQVLLVMGIAFVLFSVLFSLIRFQVLTAKAEVEEANMVRGEPFHVAILDRMSSAHRMAEPFCLYLVEVDDPDVPEARLHELKDGLRQLLRKTDTVCIHHDAWIAVVADTERRYAGIVGDRIKSWLDDQTGKKTILASASFPENGDRLAALMAELQQALDNARAQHGVQDGVSLASHEQDSGDSREDTQPKAPAAPSGILDELTGVLRSSRLPTAMRKFIAQNRKINRPVSILYADINQLSGYNKHYGNEAGDAVMKGVADLFQRNFRETDLIGRYREDEFVVLVADTPEKADIAAQRVTAEIRKSPIQWEGRTLRVAVSIGIAGYPDHGLRPHELFASAGKALAVAKSRGRGISAVYHPDMEREEDLDAQQEAF